MGKNNKNRNNQKPQRYTGKNVDYLGDPMRMERHAVDVFRDMSRGKYNFNNLNEFMNQDFVYAAIRAAQKNIRKHQILVNALAYAYGACNDPDVISLRNQENAALTGWTFIVNGLCSFTSSMDLGSLMGMAQWLSNNREIRL